MDENKMFCSKCGVELNPNSQFCSNCGASTDPSHTGEYMDIDADMRDFIGENQPYYIDKFQKMKLSRSTVSWNWVAFFFPAYWLIYRKMYLYAFVVFLVSVVFDAIPRLGAPSFALSVAAGIFANYIYMTYAEKELKIASYMGEDAKRAHIRDKGGVNWFAVFALIAVQVVWNIILLVLHISTSIVSHIFNWIF